MKSLLLLVVLLAGCATPEKPAIIKAVEVKSPVAVFCDIQLPKTPDRLSSLTTADTLLHKGNSALAELEDWAAWALKVAAAVKACSSADSTTPPKTGTP